MNTALLTNTAWGYPTRGHARRIAPLAICVVHITGNSRLPTAREERDYANRAGSGGPSSHIYLDRDGSGVRALTEEQVSWSAGDLDHPNTANPTIAAIVARAAQGYAADESVWWTLENVGYGSTYPVTSAQLDTIAGLIADTAKRRGLPIHRRTVLTHADINSVNRASCAFPPAVREARLADLIARAQRLTEAAMPNYSLGGVRTGVVAIKTPYYSSAADATPRSTTTTTRRYLLLAVSADGKRVCLDGRYDEPVSTTPQMCGWVEAGAVTDIQPVSPSTVAPAAVTVTLSDGRTVVMHP